MSEELVVETKPQMTWDMMNRAVAEHFREKGEWCGVPIPLPGYQLAIEDKNPWKHLENFVLPDETPMHVECGDSEIDDTLEYVNEWTSFKTGENVMIYRTSKDGVRRTKFHKSTKRDEARKLDALLCSMGVATIWPLDTEITAQETLARHITEWQFTLYTMTGAFMESSKRSGIVYLFRRLRPTVALTAHKLGMKALCALCLHPIGYYHETYCGAMTPTDDVLAHLMLMRGDEHMFWRRSNQHPIWSPLAGL